MKKIAFILTQVNAFEFYKLDTNKIDMYQVEINTRGQITLLIARFGENVNPPIKIHSIRIQRKKVILKGA